jgi:hypothetical protein
VKLLGTGSADEKDTANSRTDWESLESSRIDISAIEGQLTARNVTTIQCVYVYVHVRMCVCVCVWRIEERELWKTESEGDLAEELQGVEQMKIICGALFETSVSATGISR